MTRPVRVRVLRSAATEIVVWLIPVLIIGAIYFSPRHLLSPGTAVTGLVALLVLLAAVRRPDLSLLGLIAFFPFQALTLAKLWSFGLPASVVSHLGAWKETLALAVIIAAVRELMASRSRLDALDRFALGFVGLTALYALLQPSIVPGAPATTHIRLLGFRETAGFVLVLFGARHAPLGPRFAARATRTVIAVGGIVGAVGIFEVLFSSAWNHFVVHVVKYPAYQFVVLHSQPRNPADIRFYGNVGGLRVVRIGSVFLSYLTCAWYLVIPFAVGIERTIRRKASPLVLLATVLAGGALLLTQTRSAILAAVVVAFLGLVPTAGRTRYWRTQVAILLAGLALLAVPVALSTGLTNRVAASGTKSDNSSTGHISRFFLGLDTIGHYPLGLGLGTGAGTGQRFQVKSDVIAENNYLEVGDELGVLPMLIFIALTAALLLRLRRAAREHPDPLLTAMWTGGAGLAVAALFLQPWSVFEVAWTYWGLAGAALGLAHRRVRAPSRAPRRATAAVAGAGANPQPAASSASR